MTLRSGARRLLARAAYAARVAPSFEGQFVILRYHSVVSDFETASRYVSSRVAVLQKDFDAHMRFMKAHFDCVPLSVLAGRLHDRHDKFQKALAAVTFDDGYGDNFHYAWPVLKAHGVPATIFLVSDVYARRQLPWTVRLRQMSLAFDGRTEVPLPPNCSRDDARANAVEPVRLWTKYLCTCAPSEREQALTALAHGIGFQSAGGGIDDVMLSRDQIREMSEAGISFGAHTKTHPNLAFRPLEEAEQEIRVSKTDLEQALDLHIELFAYPNPGSLGVHVTEALASAVEASGYMAAVTSVDDVPADSAPLFMLPRIGVGRSTGPVELFYWTVTKISDRARERTKGLATTSS